MEKDKELAMVQKALFIIITLAMTGLFTRLGRVQAAPCPADTPTTRTCIPVIDVGLAIRRQPESGNNPANPYATIGKTGPMFAGPGTAVTYQVQLANYEAVTRTVQLTETIPATLELITSTLPVGMTYDGQKRQLRWQGQIAPAYLDYLLVPDSMALPYLDLAAFGAPDLCMDLPDCDQTPITFNLGVNGYTFAYYGELLTEITVSPNGLILAGTQTITNTDTNAWLPAAPIPAAMIAGLWRDVDMNAGTEGESRWHAAILSGLLDGHDVFYAQWHNAPHANDPDNTARHAIALLLGYGPSAGHIFFIYDNVAHPTQVVAAGYTIGLSDNVGQRGLTVAFADCCGDIPPRGYPPAAGTTYHLAPTIRYPQNHYTASLSYTAVVHTPAPETMATTVVASNDSPDPALRFTWATHYLYVREMLYLPLIAGGNE